MRSYLSKNISLEKANSGVQGCLPCSGVWGSPQRLFGTFFRKKVRKELDLTLGNFKSNMPAMGDFSVDIQSIARDALKDMPEAGIGVLADTMTSIDTTAGFTSMLSLGLDSSALNEKFEDSMQEFEDRMSIMQNLRMSEVLVKMMENFYTQLDTMNKDTYEGVKTNADKYYGDAGFKRNEAKGEWSIKVVKSAPMIGGIKYKTYRFDDYEYYQTGHVHLDEYKFNGKTIDFDDVSTFKDMDANVLEVFVNMQKNDLQKKIDEVFFQSESDSSSSSDRSTGAGGSGSSGFRSFFEHTGMQMERLFGGEDGGIGKFGKNYQRWQEGEAKRNSGRLDKPLFSGGPTNRQFIQIAATVVGTATGQPWITFAANSALLATDIATGKTYGKHALTQMGVGAVTSFGGPIGTVASIGAGGIVYDEDGGISWSKKQFKENAKREIVTGAIKLALGDNSFSAGVAAGVSSGLDTSGGWKDFSFDRSGWKDHVAVGVIAGISDAAAKGASTWSGNFNNTFSSKLVSGLVTGALSKAYGKMTDNDDFYTTDQFWAGISTTTNDMGAFLGSQAKQYFKTKYEKNRENGAEPPSFPDDPLGAMADAIGALYYGNDKVMEHVSNLRESIINGATGDGFRTNKEIAIEAALKQFEMDNAVEAGMKEIAKLEAQDYLKNRIDQMSQQGGTKLSYDLKYILKEELNISNAECERRILDGTGCKDMNEVSQMLRDGSMNVSHIIEAVGGDNIENLANLNNAYADISGKRVERNRSLAQQRALEEQQASMPDQNLMAQYGLQKEMNQNFANNYQPDSIGKQMWNGLVSGADAVISAFSSDAYASNNQDPTMYDVFSISDPYYKNALDVGTTNMYNGLQQMAGGWLGDTYIFDNGFNGDYSVYTTKGLNTEDSVTDVMKDAMKQLAKDAWKPVGKDVWADTKSGALFDAVPSNELSLLGVTGAGIFGAYTLAAEKFNIPGKIPAGPFKLDGGVSWGDSFNLNSQVYFKYEDDKTEFEFEASSEVEYEKGSKENSSGQDVKYTEVDVSMEWKYNKILSTQMGTKFTTYSNDYDSWSGNSYTFGLSGNYNNFNFGAQVHNYNGSDIDNKPYEGVGTTLSAGYNTNFHGVNVGFNNSFHYESLKNRPNEQFTSYYFFVRKNCGSNK